MPCHGVGRTLGLSLLNFWFVALAPAKLAALKQSSVLKAFSLKFKGFAKGIPTSAARHAKISPI